MRLGTEAMSRWPFNASISHKQRMLAFIEDRRVEDFREEPLVMRQLFLQAA